ncbi:hypothetical protein ANTRET_LOCUS2388 [Anthophora retusa]
MLLISSYFTSIKNRLIHVIIISIKHSVVLSAKKKKNEDKPTEFPSQFKSVLRIFYVSIPSLRDRVSSLVETLSKRGNKRS